MSFDFVFQCLKSFVKLCTLGMCKHAQPEHPGCKSYCLANKCTVEWMSLSSVNDAKASAMLEAIMAMAEPY